MLLNSSKKIITAAIISMISFIGCGPGDSSPWVWQIEGKKITVNQLENAYENYLDLMAMQLQTTVEQLKVLIEDPSSVKDPQMRMVLSNLNKQAYAEQYRTMVLLTMEAEKSGFTKKEENISKLEFFNQYYTAMIFMNSAINSDTVVVSEEDALAYWEQFRQKYPKYKNVPIAEGLEVAKQQIAQEKVYKERQDMTKSILESYKIEKNKEFDLDAYFAAAEKVEKTEEPVEATE